MVLERPADGREVVDDVEGVRGGEGVAAAGGVDPLGGGGEATSWVARSTAVPSARPTESSAMPVGWVISASTRPSGWSRHQPLSRAEGRSGVPSASISQARAS